MKIIKLFTFVITATIATSCVSSKIYEDLKKTNETLKAENELLSTLADGTKGDTSAIALQRLRATTETLKAEKTRAEMELAATTKNYKQLKESYDALATNSSENLSENLERNRKLLEQLEAKEKQLNEKAQMLDTQEQRLAQVQKELTARSKRVEELESIIAAKDAQMKNLKDAISAALISFEGNGLTVEQRDGKVYVSMENKLLFESGSWTVNSRGREAVETLGNVLANNKEIAVLIEGHTDNVPYGEKGTIANNWDLSTKRATSIVNILTENTNIPKNNLTAAGRGEFAPVASNDTAEGRAKNRRIEVILTPKLDQISKLLKEI